MTAELCSDCPPEGYLTNKTRCEPCPRRGAHQEGLRAALEPFARVAEDYDGHGPHYEDDHRILGRIPRDKNMTPPIVTMADLRKARAALQSAPVPSGENFSEEDRRLALSAMGKLTHHEISALHKSLRISDATRKAFVGNLHPAPVSTTPDQSAAGWREIKSAPKDGTRILVWHDRYYAPSNAIWGGTSWKPHSDLPAFKYQPTHWRPLPPPPAGEKESGA